MGGRLLRRRVASLRFAKPQIESILDEKAMKQSKRVVHGNDPLLSMAEEVGFEPTDPLSSTVFKTAALSHSAIPPSMFSMVRHARQSKRIQGYHIIAPMNDEDYMRLAIEEARRAASLDEVPIGAVVVYNPIDKGTRRPLLPEPRVIARACNLRETTQDPAGHAEFLAMKAAAKELGVWRLTGCTVYVTLEPCIMCAGLMHQARINRCVYGASDQKAGALGTLYAMNADERLNHNYPVQAGVLGDECAQLLTDYFASKRKAAKRKQATQQESQE